MRPIDLYFLEQEEPVKSCLQFMRTFILSQDEHVSEEWKYRMPFYCYEGKMFCYLWIHKKYKQPYVGFVEGKELNDPDLLLEKRSRMKILLLNPAEDLHVDKIRKILSQAIKIKRETIRCSQ